MVLSGYLRLKNELITVLHNKKQIFTFLRTNVISHNLKQIILYFEIETSISLLPIFFRLIIG